MSPLAFGLGSHRAFGIGRKTSAAAPPAATIVTSGLRLYADAGIPSSYPGSGTTWSDISGAGKIGTLTPGTTYSTANGGSIYFGGASQADFTGEDTLTHATFSIWIKRNGAQIDFTGVLIGRGVNATGLIFSYPNFNLGYMWNDGFYYFDSGLTPPNQAWCMWVVTVTPDEAKVYMGTSAGIASATSTWQHDPTILSSVAVGADPVGYSRNFKGSITQALIYNRALTLAEITTNFNAMRGRHGV